MPKHSIGHHLYYITFTDGFSRKMLIYYLRNKDGAFEMFKDSKTLIKNQIREKINISRFENDGEYTSKEFIDFCKKEGIKKEQIVPDNPEQNGLAERKNKSITVVSHAMLHDLNLPKFLWEETTNVVAYVQNRILHQELDKKTPEEIFIGVKPDPYIFSSPYTFMFQRIKGTSWMPQEEMLHLLNNVRILNNLEYILLVKGRLKIARMLH